MARIKIKDLAEDQKISKKELRNVVGGGFFADIGQFYDDAFAKAWHDANVIADWAGNAVGGSSSGGSGTSGGGGGGSGTGVPTRRK